MGVSRTEKTKNAAIYEIIFDIVQTVFAFLIRSAIIKYLGDAYLGLNSLCTSVLNVLNAADLGLDAALLHYLYKPVAEKRRDEICRLLNFARAVYRLIGIIIFIAGLCVLPFFDRLVRGQAPDGINVQIVFFIMLLYNLLGYEINAYQRFIFQADQRTDLVNKIVIVVFVSVYVLQLLLIRNGCYYLYIVSFCFFNIFSAFLYTRTKKRLYPQYKYEGRVSKEFRHTVWKDIIGVGVYRIRDLTRNSLDSIVLSAMLGLVPLALYQNYYTVLTVPVLLRAVLLNSVTSSMGNYNAMEGVDKVYQIYRVLLFVQMTLSGWVAFFYCYLIKDFIIIWLGAGYVLPDLTTFLFGVMLYMLGFGDMGKLLRTVCGVWRSGKWQAVLEMVMNLLLNCLLARLFGINGIILATILSMLIIYIPSEGYILMKACFHQSIGDSAKTVLKNLVWVIVTGLLLLMLNRGIPQIYFWRLVIKAGCCLVVPAVTFFVMYRKSWEWKYLCNTLKFLWERRGFGK